ncbi:MAG: HAMP domain-containing histidine kinase [Conexibacteraceae bacterium]|nr:HAMP domain-containing histidine kinase [Conexibacteraceae bacterium]
MSLRKRITSVAAATVAVAVAIAVLVSYFVVKGQLVGQIDTELQAQAAAVQATYGGPHSQFPGLAADAGGSAPYWQVVSMRGDIANGVVPGKQPLPAGNQAAAVANGTVPDYFSNVFVDGARLRMYTFNVTPPSAYSGQTSFAVQLARPLDAVDNVMRTLRWALAVIFLAVVALAAGLARLATRRVMRPLAEVTATAQLIGETDDLSQRIAVREDDEVGQLATRFNEMLERLEHSRAQLDASVSAQRQLVADASHELRTPVTSLRTNIEVLLSGAKLDEEDRNRLLADVVEQSEELSVLVNDLIEVSRGDAPATGVEDTRLDRLVEEAVDRARRNAPDAEFAEHLQPVSVQGNPERLVRAINNLLDNAALHAGHGGAIDVTVDEIGVTVRDHGDGIDDRDLPHVFDRFYRGANSRARQGSGLGLAIVRQVAEQHHGTVTAANAPDGGAVFTLRLAASAVPDDAGVPSDAEVSA